ncbi:hypothetical protein IFM89_021697 [Coptis chinensis]|uniref:RRM domain-containing protein n=1 Tax=Coptis chinensis TaxID=261450 RepID=A0A835MD68_9MAGN|nr:hypothetical protein IFM89_021697 [Coptis chinensis]
MAIVAVFTVAPPPLASSSLTTTERNKHISFSSTLNSLCISSSLFHSKFPSLSLSETKCKIRNDCFVVGCLPSSPSQKTGSSTNLFVSGLSFRTTEEGLRNAFQNFGQLVDVNLVMDRIANRPRGFAFVRYATEEESNKAIEGMHGKFLDGRVIFVEIAKPRSEMRQDRKQPPRRY